MSLNTASLNAAMSSAANCNTSISGATRFHRSRLNAAMLAAVVLVAPLSAHPVRAQGAKVDKPHAVPPCAVSLTTIHDEKLRAELVAITDGKLLLKTEPPRAIPLDELDRVEFDKARASSALIALGKPVASPLAQLFGKAAPRALTAKWLGQDNHDFAQPGPSEGGNGIQDIHIQLTGIPSNRSVLQVVVEQAQSSWRMDPSGTPNWRLIVQRKGGADTADLYAEPSQGDRNGGEFKITLAFDNGTTATTSVKATSSTNPELKVASGSAAANATSDAPPANVDALAIVVHLEGLGELSGRLEALGQESLRLSTATAGVVEVPLLATRGVWFQSAGGQGVSGGSKAKERFAARLNSPGDEDAALVRGEDQSVTEIAGQILQLKEQKLQFKYEGESRSINIARVVGLVFAAHAKSAPTDRPYQVFELVGGNRLSGSWTGFADGALEVQAAWGGELKIPAAKVASIVFRNGKLVYLSDLEPLSVEEVPYFDRAMPYQRDKNLLGEPLKLKGKEHRKGLAVHSRSVLNYALEGKYVQFKSLVGFDDSVPARGRVVCRVLADGKPIFSEADLRADAKPKSVELDVKGVRQLTLEIDFGEDENICDRVIWADARLYRE
jgi:NPCBM/NEW2 domain